MLEIANLTPQHYIDRCEREDQAGAAERQRVAPIYYYVLLLLAPLLLLLLAIKCCCYYYCYYYYIICDGRRATCDARWATLNDGAMIHDV